MINFGNLITTLLTYYLPIEDATARINVSLAVGQAIGLLIKQGWNYIKNASIWRSITKYNSIAISSDHPAFYKIILYYYKKHGDKMKSIELLQKGGEMHLMIEYMKVKAIADGDIYVSMAKESMTALASFENIGENSGQNDNMRSGQRILFRSTKSVPFIDEYVKRIIKECSSLESNLLTIYNIDIEKSEKQTKVNWKPIECVSNKTTANNIVSEDIQRDFYDDIKKFVDTEESYNRRGIAFRRGYMITGLPGSGKSTLWESIANEYRWPVFRMDMSVLSDNSQVIGLLNSINDYISTGQKHILLLEDLDRSCIFDRWRRGNNNITDDSLLNMIESRGAHGRIIIITGNDRSRMRDAEVGDAMFRSGRIDRDIKLNNCTIPQIEGIIRLYFEYEELLELDSEIEITVADLNKVVQLKPDVDSTVKFLNRFKKLNGGDYIEELIKMCDNGNSTEENKDVPINIDDVKKKAKNRSLRRRQKKEIDMEAPKKPRGLGILEKNIRDVENREKKQMSRKDINDIDFQIEELQIKKLRIEIEKREKDLGDQMEAYRTEVKNYELKKKQIEATLENPSESDGNVDKTSESNEMDNQEKQETSENPETPENFEKREFPKDERELTKDEQEYENDVNQDGDSIDGSSATNEVHSDEEDNVAGWSDTDQ
jgi:hypothetical protein